MSRALGRVCWLKAGAASDGCVCLHLFFFVFVLFSLLIDCSGSYSSVSAEEAVNVGHNSPERGGGRRPRGVSAPRRENLQL